VARLTLKLDQGLQPLVLCGSPRGGYRLGTRLPGSHKVLSKVALQASLLPAPGTHHKQQGQQDTHQNTHTHTATLTPYGLGSLEAPSVLNGHCV